MFLRALFFSLTFSFFFFFFQAEDGIRDHCMTGVQTCALPISPIAGSEISRKKSARQYHCKPGGYNASKAPCSAGYGIAWMPSSSGEPKPRADASALSARSRSEERRVGKECGRRGSRYAEK